jgi:hypothetical protein
MFEFPILFGDMAQLAIGWGIFFGGVIIAGALVCFPPKRKDPTADEGHG